MPIHIRRRETERLARALARAAKLSLTEAVHVALENELTRRRKMPLWERTAPLRRRVRARVKEARRVDKTFRDSLYEDAR
jgi:hypothetical protein